MDAQSILQAAGPQAQRIEALWWAFLVVGAVTWVAVVAALLRAILRRRPRGDATPIVTPPAGGSDPATRVPIEAPDPVSGARTRRTIAALVGATAAILVALLAASASVGAALSGLSHRAALTVEVVGHQWWWEVRYPDAVPSRTVTTANELHLPVGIPVKLRLRSRDVIHSLWIPALHGKRDLVPGRDAELTLQADRAGELRGQCAEFCGVQHAKMAIRVVAEPPEAFQAWLAAQRRPAAEPAGDEARRGREVFLRSACVMCHRIQGTSAASLVGPDLTHLASRTTLGAGALPNTRGHLAGWIANAQAAKPGSLMPPQALDGADLQALLAYLEGLR